MIVNLDGRFVSPEQAGLPCDDGAILFGDTLFETIKVRDGRVLLIEAHLDRLQMSAALLDFPCERDAVRTALQETAARCPWPTARIRLTLSRGRCQGLPAPPLENARMLITAVAYIEPDRNERSTGVACVFAPNRRVNPLSHLPQMKRGNYADCLYAARHARARGAREALFRNDNGSILEGATSNIFMVKGNSLITPEAGELVLAGVMRRQVLQAAENLGMKTEERPISCDELYAADEVFLTNALIEVLPVCRIEAEPLKMGPVAETLRQRLDEH